MRLNRLTLIRPNMGDYRSRDALTPLALAILAAWTPERVAVTFFDDRVEIIPPDDRPDMVALSVETFTAKRAYEIARQYRSRGVTVVMGGYHPSLLPEEALEHADAVVIGDAEGVWQELIDDFETGRLRRTYTGGNAVSLRDYRIDRTIFEGKRYLPLELIQFGRGCKHHCDFCSIESFYKHTIRYREIESVVDELKTFDKKRMVFFVDDNLFNAKKVLDTLLEAITPLKIRWACQISIDVAQDEALLDRMAASGCRLVIVGFESLVDANLDQMGKGWNKRSGQYREVIDTFHRRGIAVYGTFVFGYDFDTVEVIRQSLQFAMETRLEIANFNPLTPTPGTPLYARLEHEGRLIHKTWWLEQGYRYGDPIFVPKRMSPDAFAAECYAARKDFYAWSSIVRRVVAGHLKFSPYLFAMIMAANVVSQMEIKRKQNRVLGAP